MLPSVVRDTEPIRQGSSLTHAASTLQPGLSPRRPPWPLSAPLSCEHLPAQTNLYRDGKNATSHLGRRPGSRLHGRAAPLVEALSPTPKGGGFDPSWGTCGRQPTDVSLSRRCFALSPFISIPEVRVKKTGEHTTQYTDDVLYRIVHLRPI